MNRPLLTALLAALVCLVAPGAALAQDAKAPPGLSGADEYLETVPDAGGNGTVNNGRRPSASDPEVAAATKAALPAVTARALASRGDSGKDAAALAGLTAPAASRTGANGDGGKGGGATGGGANGDGPLGAAAPPIPPKDPPSGGPLASVGRIATGSGGEGMGALFPLLIVAGALTVAGTALWRRRDRTG